MSDDFSNEEAQEAANWIKTSPACSYWLKNAFASALERDPVDAWKDANLLARILKGNTK